MWIRFITAIVFLPSAVGGFFTFLADHLLLGRSPRRFFTFFAHAAEAHKVWSADDTRW
jgi:hypothetical protein